ncbi:MAG: hypothetical protein LBB84_12905 [Tannerellaceae bacterium]|jgi:hypothetical protein|nr:hypothetical protein [Tannerellaceae bacterium]
MDKLKNFVETNREDFEDDFLPEGHIARFEKKLEKKKYRRTRAVTALTMTAAAVALFLFLLKTQGDTRNILPGQPLPFVCESEGEIEELRMYYNMRMYDVETQVEDLYAQGENSGSLELMEEVERVMQTTYNFETDILPTLPCSETALFVLNQHYGNSLESLNFMLRQMQQIVNTYK